MSFNTGRPHKIVQVNTLHELNGILVIEIFEVKVEYTIYPRELLSRHYGISFLLKNIFNDKWVKQPNLQENESFLGISWKSF